MTYTNNTNYTAKAVVLGLGINGLAIVRSLGVCGVEVLGTYVHDNEFGRFSRYCKPIRLPRLEDGEEEFLRELIGNLGDPDGKPVLFAQSDQYVMFMSRYREQLQTHFHFVLPEHGLLENLVKKDRSVTFVAEKGLRVPETYVPSKNEIVEEIVTRVTCPCVVKPVDSFSVTLGAKILTFIDAGSLKAFLRERPELIGSIIIQEIIPGGDSNTYQATVYVPKDARKLPIFTMRKIRQCPPGFGITSYGISESDHSLAKIVQEFLDAIGYRGLISIEFKKHPQTGEWIYIEANPRLPYYHALIYDSGINYPFMYYQDVVGEKVSGNACAPQRNGVRWIYFTSDLESVVKRSSARGVGLLRWLVSVIRARSFAFLNVSDMKPFFQVTHWVMKMVLRRLVNSVNGVSRTKRKNSKDGLRAKDHEPG